MAQANLTTWDGQLLGKSAAIFVGPERTSDRPQSTVEVVAAPCSRDVVEELANRRRNPPHETSVFVRAQISSLARQSGVESESPPAPPHKLKIIERLALDFPRKDPVPIRRSSSGRASPSVTTTEPASVGPVHLPVERLGCFLSQHRDARLVCYDVTSIFWPILTELRRQGDNAGQQVLWELARNSRIEDIQLLDQRLHLIALRRFPVPRPLNEIVVDYCGDHLPDGFGARTPERREVSAADRLDALDWFTAASKVVVAVATVYAVMCGPIISISTEFGIPTAVVRRFGPLGHGTDVQGAIALKSPDRRAMDVSAKSIEAAAEAGEVRVRNSSTALVVAVQAGEERFRNTSAPLPDPLKEAFEWEEGRVKRDSNGLPQTHTKALRRQLAKALVGTQDHRGVPFLAPLDSRGHVSTIPWHWNSSQRGSPLVRAWTGLVEAAAACHWLSSMHMWNTPPKFDVFPTIHSVLPDLSGLRRLGQPFFRPRTDQMFVRGQLTHLELRCFARTCLDYRYDSVRIGQMFARPEDAIRQTANAMRERNWAGYLPIGRTYRSTGSGDDEWWQRVATVLWSALPRGLGQPQIRELLIDDLGDPNLGFHDVDVLQGLLVDVHPELTKFLADATCECIGFHLGLDSETTYDALFNPSTGFDIDVIANTDSLEPAIRNVLWSRTSGNGVWDTLGSLAQTPMATARIRRTRRGEPILLMWWPVTSAGCVGRIEYCTQYKSMEYLLLADQVMKQVLFDLVAAGYDLLAVDGEEFVIQAPKGEPNVMHDVQDLADAAAEPILKELAIRCCVCQPQDRW
jgi:hypothetical protein